VLMKQTSKRLSALAQRACTLTFDTHPEKLITGHGVRSSTPRATVRDHALPVRYRGGHLRSL
jgi:hypothetical protein